MAAAMFGFGLQKVDKMKVDLTLPDMSQRLNLTVIPEQTVGQFKVEHLKKGSYASATWAQYCIVLVTSQGHRLVLEEKRQMAEYGDVMDEGRNIHMVIQGLTPEQLIELNSRKSNKKKK